MPIKINHGETATRRPIVDTSTVSRITRKPPHGLRRKVHETHQGFSAD